MSAVMAALGGAILGLLAGILLAAQPQKRCRHHYGYSWGVLQCTERVIDGGRYCEIHRPPDQRTQP